MSLIFITFIFKMNDITYHGKYYTDYISPDHKGLDDEIRPYLLKGILEYQKKEILPKLKKEVIDNVQICIMSLCNEKYISLHSTNEEKNCFDFHCEKYTINHTICMKMHMFGKLI